MTQNQFPPGWDEQKVCKLIQYYDSQTDEAIAAEIDAVYEGYTMVEVPTELVSLVTSLIARYEQGIPLEVLKETIRNMPVEAHSSA